MPFDFFVTAVISCQQLITAVKADKIENPPREVKFGMCIYFSVYMKIPINFSMSAVISCKQLSTADNS